MARLRSVNPFLFLAFAVSASIVAYVFLRIFALVIVQIVKEHFVWFAVAATVIAVIVIAWLS